MSLILIGSLIVLGVGALTAGGLYVATADERELADLEKRVQEIDASLDGFKNACKCYEDVEDKILKANEYLNDAKNDFKNGGHVQDDIPLANVQFYVTIRKLHDAIGNLENMLDGLEKEIAELEQEKIKCNNRIEELRKEMQD